MSKPLGVVHAWPEVAVQELWYLWAAWRAVTRRRQNSRRVAASRATNDLAGHSFNIVPPVRMRAAALAQDAAGTRFIRGLNYTSRYFWKWQVAHKQHRHGQTDTQTARAALLDVYRDHTEDYLCPTVRVRHDYKQEVNRKQKLLFFLNVILTLFFKI